MRKISDEELNQLLGSDDMFSKDTDLKVSYKSFEFTIFKRTFKFETFIKHSEPGKIFTPVEPCETNIRLCVRDTPPYTEEDIIRYKNRLEEHEKIRESLKKESPIPGVPPNYDGHSHLNRFN